MSKYRERLGIRQNFDDWAKGINNQLDNLRKQGFENVANYNIDVLRSDGWEIVTDKNGNEKLSRAGSNKERYNTNETYETAKAKRESLVNVKEAKTMSQEQMQSMTPTTKDYTPPSSVEEWGEYEDEPYYTDEFDLAGDYYELAQILASEISQITGGPYDIYGALNVLSNGHGGRSELDNYKALARDYASNLMSMNGDLDDYYNS